ncbi:UNVERIFIED_CONTAM: hypothetical protein FKN15_048092 [Acipenser sinensis]
MASGKGRGENGMKNTNWKVNSLIKKKGGGHSAAGKRRCWQGGDRGGTGQLSRGSGLCTRAEKRTGTWNLIRRVRYATGSDSVQYVDRMYRADPATVTLFNIVTN